MLFLGNASGHDIQFHLASWIEVAGQWREGIVYPRWAEWANWGFGEPRFIFYPPASWIIGAALGSVVPWRLVPGAFIYLTLIVAGMSMWRLARDWLPGPRAAVAALSYVVNPYHLVIVYYRSDFAELVASALLPLLLWAALHVTAGEWRRVPALAATFGAIWLSNAPAAVIATYSLVLILVVACIAQRSARPLLPSATAMASGFGLAAFYVLPAAWERRWVQIAQALGDGLRPAQNFLFTRTNDPDFVLFNWRVSWVAVGMLVATTFAIVFALPRRREFQKLWWILTSLGVASVFVMLRPSLWLWDTLPEFRFVQFPWRWLEVLGVVFAFMMAAAIFNMRNRRVSLVIGVVVFAAIGATAVAIIRTAWWDDQDVPVMRDAIDSGRGYEGTDEYAPIGADRLDLPGNTDDTQRPVGISSDPAPRIEKLSAASGTPIPAAGVRLHIELWSATRKLFTEESSAPVTLALRLLNYPSWELRVDGNRARILSRPPTSQMILPLAAGAHRVELQFRRTWDRTTGDAISGFTVIALVGFSRVSRKKQRPAAGKTRIQPLATAADGA